MSDAELALASRAGDKKAFVEIVTRYQAMVCGIALGVLGDFAASEDAGQESFLIAWKKIHQLAEPEKLRGWLGQIARTSALSQLRKRHGHTSLDELEEMPDSAREPSVIAAIHEEAALVLKALNSLPDSCRLPLILYYREGKSSQAIAEALGVNEATVRQRLSRGRDLLRDQLSGVVERVLVRTAPTSAFVIGIAVGIGALAAPSAVAATAFGISTNATLSAKFLTIMNTSKTLIIASALTAAVCLPVGYQVANRPGERASNEEKERFAYETNASGTNKTFRDSELLAEWRRLHEAHGIGPEAMPGMFIEVSELKNDFRRRAFRTALISEWVEVNAASAFKFFSAKGRDENQRKQLLEEWLRRDPQSAVSTMLTAGSDWDGPIRSLLTEVAKMAPSHLGVLVSKLPKAESYWDNSVLDAFATFAATDLESARKTAEQIDGPNRERALSGIAKRWSAIDSDSAMKWIRSLPPGPESDEVLRSAIIGKAGTDPVAALDMISLAHPGGRDGYFATSTGARVLNAAVNANFDKTVGWIANHPGRLSNDDLMGMAGAVTERLNANAQDFLTSRLADGSLAAIVPAIDSALMNRSSGQRPAVWNWLQMHSDEDSLNALRNGVINAGAWQDPEFATSLVQDFPSGKLGDDEVQQLAQGLLNGGSMMYRLDGLLQNGPERLKVPLLEKAFAFLRPDNLEDPNLWINRASQLPADARNSAFESIGRAWAEKNPDDALRWAMGLPAQSAQGPAVRSAISSYATSDPQAAAAWVSDLPASSVRDEASRGLAMAIAENYPREAWAWALSIQSVDDQLASAEYVAKIFANRNQAAARQMIDSSSLSDEFKNKLHASISSENSTGVLH